ncbi:MAG: dihydroneopterin aldolase [Candidatus Kryptoniota bacterium]
MQQQVIRLKNATFYAYHGVLSNEQISGGKFEVDVDLYGDYSRAAQTDKLRDTVNYEEIFKSIEDLVTGKRYYLIESLGAHIAEKIIEKYTLVNRVVVRVRKHHPQIGGVVDFVEFETEKARGS